VCTFVEIFSFTGKSIFNLLYFGTFVVSDCLHELLFVFMECLDATLGDCDQGMDS